MASSRATCSGLGPQALIASATNENEKKRTMFLDCITNSPDSSQRREIGEIYARKGVLTIKMLRRIRTGSSFTGAVEVLDGNRTREP